MKAVLDGIGSPISNFPAYASGLELFHIRGEIKHHDHDLYLAAAINRSCHGLEHTIGHLHGPVRSGALDPYQLLQVQVVSFTHHRHRQQTEERIENALDDAI